MAFFSGAGQKVNWDASDDEDESQIIDPDVEDDSDDEELPPPPPAMPEPEPEPEPVDIVAERKARIPDRPPFTAYIGGLKYELNEQDLGEFFHRCGAIKDVRVIRKDGESKGFAYVEFAEAAGLEAALEYEGRELRGRKLRVDVSEAPRGGGGRRRGGGGGYRDGGGRWEPPSGDRPPMGANFRGGRHLQQQPPLPSHQPRASGGAAPAPDSSSGPPPERKRLQLKPRTVAPPEVAAAPTASKNSSIFGSGSARDEKAFVERQKEKAPVDKNKKSKQKNAPNSVPPPATAAAAAAAAVGSAADEAGGAPKQTGEEAVQEVTMQFGNLTAADVDPGVKPPGKADAVKPDPEADGRKPQAKPADGDRRSGAGRGADRTRVRGKKSGRGEGGRGAGRGDRGPRDADKRNSHVKDSKGQAKSSQKPEAPKPAAKKPAKAPAANAVKQEAPKKPPPPSNPFALLDSDDEDKMPEPNTRGLRRRVLTREGRNKPAAAQWLRSESPPPNAVAADTWFAIVGVATRRLMLSSSAQVPGSSYSTTRQQRAEEVGAENHEEAAVAAAVAARAPFSPSATNSQQHPHPHATPGCRILTFQSSPHAHTPQGKPPGPPLQTARTTQPHQRGNGGVCGRQAVAESASHSRPPSPPAQRSTSKYKDKNKN
eukprot:CAMPEP_0118964412 /NCGR_PEP_ID=MMETSP1173-20130426/2113_1 /TAXON_ID=1034831 /ORGANISM="Rhizochromulina marina cf, Strain CCMP1243" /LENGTH=654 /DNA_ID=CAMNT_0006912867 /DNA_START=55 /DNA_END=2018 /DNA_ORIENTATION=+